jgi:hypothetical protein
MFDTARVKRHDGHVYGCSTQSPPPEGGGWWVGVVLWGMDETGCLVRVMTRGELSPVVCCPGGSTRSQACCSARKCRWSSPCWRKRLSVVLGLWWPDGRGITCQSTISTAPLVARGRGEGLPYRQQWRVVQVLVGVMVFQLTEQQFRTQKT